MSVFIASDLHLDDQKPELYQAFFSFIDNLPTDTTALYLLGDLFEYWIGDDYKTPHIDLFIQKIRTLENRGIQCFIQHGNRDFLIGKKFLLLTGMSLLPDAFVFINGTDRVLMCHGDQLCTLDKEYQRSRKILRNPLIKWIARHLPLNKRLEVAERGRNYSKNYNQKNPVILDVTPEAVDNLMSRYNADILIHGHTHKPATYNLDNNRQRFVLGSWHSSGGIVARLDGNSVTLMESSELQSSADAFKPEHQNGTESPGQAS